MALSGGEDRLKNPKIAALMANVGSDENIKTRNHPTVPHPPTTFEDFLNYEKIDEWPQRLTSEGVLDLSELPRNLWSLEEIQEEIAQSAPFGLDCFVELEQQLEDFSDRLNYFSAFISSTEERPSRIPDNLFHAPRKEILDKAAEFDAVKLHHSRRKKKKDVKETLQEAAQASRTRNIDYVAFPGFRPKELTELPSQLEAPQLLNKVTEAQTFNKGFHQLWKKLFLSEASVAILQDTFWWYFLENFEHHPNAQDKLFTRIADSYIGMFFSANADIRDKFFREYPRCLAQCVQVTFCEAFPESTDRFTEEFVSELASLTSEWITGVQPPVGEWKKWPWDKLGYPRPGDVGSPTAQNDHEGALGMRRASDGVRDMSFEVDAYLPDEGPGAPTDGGPNVVITVPDESIKSAKVAGSDSKRGSRSKSIVLATQAMRKYPMAAVKESAQAGPGPDFERVMFNTGGRSPLVAHHLYMKHLRDKKSVGKSMKRTEVLQQQAAGMTFEDVIAKSKKTIKALHAQREKSAVAAHIDIMKLHSEHKQAIRQMKELEKSLTDPLEIKIRSDKVLDQALEKGLYRSSNYGGSKTTSSKHTDLLKDDDNAPKSD